MYENIIGKYCVVRCDKAGVFAGIVVEVADNGAAVKMRDARKLWEWHGACAVEQIAKDGVKKPKECRFTVTIDEMVVADAVQILPCTTDADAIIKEVAEWKIR